MKNVDVLIVGAGPAGTSCGATLQSAGLDCLLVDRVEFPRSKVCAGWITPQIWNHLKVDPKDYPYPLTHFGSFQVAIKNLKFKLPTHQYAIRRIEFDHWLLERSGVKFEFHEVKEIQKIDGGYEIDGEYRCKYLIGAGGTHCPVNKVFFSPAAQRPKRSFIVAMEDEFQTDITDHRCYLWFFQNNLPGYAWYVPKANGYLNVGIGGLSQKLKSSGLGLRDHWNFLSDHLKKLDLVHQEMNPKGHSYYLRHKSRNYQKDNAYLIGDSAGYATLDLGEGINAAVQSGVIAAEAIINGKEYFPKNIPRYSIWSLLFSNRKN